MVTVRTHDNTLDFGQLVLPGARGATGDNSNKADLVDGKLDPTQLPDTVAVYTIDGELYALRAGVLERLATRPEVDEQIAAVTFSPDVLAKVGAPEWSGTLALNTDGSTYTPIPTALVGDGASGEGYHCFPAFQYSGAGGIKIRRKSNGSAVTNLLGFPSFEGGSLPAGWSSSGGVTITVDNGDSRSGTYSLKATVTATSSGQQVYSPWCPIEQGIKASTASYIKRIAGGARTCRIDAQYGDATASDASPTVGILSSVTGSNVTPGTDWSTRGIMDSAHLGGTGLQIAPSGAAKVRLRFTIVSPSSGDIFRLDDSQVERADTIPAYGSTGGSGGALSMYGGWATPTPTPIAQAAGVTPVVATFATTGAQYLSGFQSVNVGGTGLTGQRIEYEATVATPGQATSITWAVLSYARVSVSS